MNSLNSIATEVTVDDSTVRVRFQDGTNSRTSIQLFPRFEHATPQRRMWRMIGTGDGIHWPEIDEGISIRTLGGELPSANPSLTRIEEVLRLVGEIYKASYRLREISGRRAFTLDEQYVALGKERADYIDDLRPVLSGKRLVDAETKTGGSIQIMLAGPTGTKFAVRWSSQINASQSYVLHCLKLTTSSFQEISNGAFLGKLVDGRGVGQVQLSVKRLSKHNSALLGKAHSLSSINHFLCFPRAEVA